MDESDLEGSEGGDRLSETAEAMDEWDEAGIVGADGSLPEGDPLPELDPDEIGEPYSQLSDDGRRDRISKACIAEFIEEGLGMTPDWAWTKCVGRSAYKSASEDCHGQQCQKRISEIRQPRDAVVSGCTTPGWWMREPRL